jgi:A/G-specific adenine glycosylase
MGRPEGVEERMNDAVYHPLPVDVRRFRRALMGWYDTHHRLLPWRGERDPYRVWVSEAMLQQTRVEVVRERYAAFLRRFPDLASLAAATEEEVVAAWSGMGYYRRARNLHAAARAIVQHDQGRFPRDPSRAVELPGVGRYTARAVLSIAYGLPLAVVDGNVARVLSRLLMIPVRPASRLQEVADRLLDPDRAGESNQATMELGAMVCLPKRPRCGECPVRSLCLARREGRVDRFPPAEPRARIELVATGIWVLRDARGRLWMERREIAPLRGLWMFPWREGTPVRSRSATLEPISHSIMRRRYQCSVVTGDGDPSSIPGPAAGPGRWIERRRILDLPHPSLVRKVLAILSPGRRTYR